MYDVNWNADPDSTGFLSSLLGVGCECDGYNVQIVGHSLGGAIAALLGLRVWLLSLAVMQLSLIYV